MTNGGIGARSIRVNSPDSIQRSVSNAWRMIQGLEGRVEVIAIGWIQRILRVVLIGGIERVVGNVPIRWIGGVPGS